jgi:AcrR family transcriptional regulator
MAAVNPSNGRAALLEAAARVFAAEGPGAVTVRRLAREVGTSTMALYSNFAGKNDLIAATADEFISRFAEALRAVPRTDDALADFVGIGRTYRAISLANPNLYRVAFQSGRLSLSDDTPRGTAEIFGYCADLLARCLDQGAFPSGEPVPMLIVLWTGVHGQVSFELENLFSSPEAADAAWDGLFRAMLIGLGADPDHVARAQERGDG